MNNMGTELLPKDVFDRQLVREAASKLGQVSAQDLSDAVGGTLTPAQALSRTMEVLEKIDPFTVAQKQKLATIELSNLISSMRQDAISIGDDKARNTMLRGLELYFKRLDAATMSIDDIVTKLSVDHAKFFASALMAAFGIIQSEFEARGIVISDEDSKAIIEAGATRGLAYLEEVTVQVE